MADVSQRVVVVGAALAGVRSAEQLRKSGYAGELVLIGEEPYEPYNRPPLSKRLTDTLALPSPLSQHRSMRGVALRLGTVVRSSNLAERTITLDGGEELSWQGLVVATGLRARRLTIDGPRIGPLRLRSFDDALALRRAIKSARSVLVVGGGFIGCEIAAGAAALGMTVVVVAPEPQPLLNAVGAHVGEEVRRRLERLGVQFRLGTVPVQYLGTDRVCGARLSDLTELHADVVVEAVGSVPSTGWLTGNGLDLTDGVLTDRHLRVAGRDDVVACGDVARFPLWSGTPQRFEHWTVAVDTARLAGANLARHMTGSAERPVEAHLMPSFWSHMAALRLQAFGMPALGFHDVRVLEGDLRGEVVVGYHRDERLVGVVLIGMGARYSHYLRALQDLHAPEPVGADEGQR